MTALNENFNEFHSIASDSNWSELVKLFKSLHDDVATKDASVAVKGSKSVVSKKAKKGVNLDEEIDAYFDDIDLNDSPQSSNSNKSNDPSDESNTFYKLFQQDNFGQLPLYYALFRDAPPKVVENFLLYSTLGNNHSLHNMCSVKTKDGVHLLHVAAGFSNNVDVIKLIYRHFTPAVTVKDVYGCLPVDHAKKQGIKRSNRAAIIQLLNPVSSLSRYDVFVNLG